MRTRFGHGARNQVAVAREVFVEAARELQRLLVVALGISPARRTSSNALETPGIARGTLRPNHGSAAKAAASSSSFRIARTMRRVSAIGMRRPSPYGPSIQPVFTSHTREPAATRWRKSSAYSTAGRGMNGDPKQVLNVGCGLS